jgi:hypothetical protein
MHRLIAARGIFERTVTLSLPMHSFLRLCGHSRNGSLLITTRLMDENPTLLRLKELETLEKVTEKVDKLTVFGGIEGVLKDVVRIRVPAN